MSPKSEPRRIAVLDDYQGVSLMMADWSALQERATVTVFSDHLADADAVVERLQPFDIYRDTVGNIIAWLDTQPVG